MPSSPIRQQESCWGRSPASSSLPARCKSCWASGSFSCSSSSVWTSSTSPASWPPSVDATSSPRSCPSSCPCSPPWPSPPTSSTTFGLGLDFNESIALAGILALTSLGVAAKVLVDEGYLREPIGIRIFTTALIAEADCAAAGGIHSGPAYAPDELGRRARPARADCRLHGGDLGAREPRDPALDHAAADASCTCRSSPSDWCWAGCSSPSSAPRRWDCTARWAHCCSARPCRGCPTRCGGTSRPA